VLSASVEVGVGIGVDVDVDVDADMDVEDDSINDGLGESDRLFSAAICDKGLLRCCQESVPERAGEVGDAGGFAIVEEFCGCDCGWRNCGRLGGGAIDIGELGGRSDSKVAGEMLDKERA
jgi:hypothetical protein